MKTNKVVLNGETIIDLSQDTAIESDVAAGKTFHKADGSVCTGTYKLTLQEKEIAENGEYEPKCENTTLEWDKNTKYDFSILMNGSVTQFKKMDTALVPENKDILNSDEYSFTLHFANGTSDIVPFTTIGVVDLYDGVFGLNGEVIMWVKNADDINNTYNTTEFEDGFVYVNDNLWTTRTGAQIPEDSTLSAILPGKKCDGFSKIIVNLPIFNSETDIEVA